MTIRWPIAPGLALVVGETALQISTYQNNTLAVALGIGAAGFLVSAFLPLGWLLSWRPPVKMVRRDPKAPVLTGTEVDSEGVTWRHLGGSTNGGPYIGAYCKTHGVYFLFRHNRTGGVEKPRDYHVISREKAYWPTSDPNGALFCGDGEGGGHRVYFDQDPRNYGQALKIAQPLIQARLNRARANP